MDWTPIYEGSELYQFKLSKILLLNVGFHFLLEFFVKSLRQMLPEVYILLRRFKIFGLFKSTYYC